MAIGFLHGRIVPLRSRDTYHLPHVRHVPVTYAVDAVTYTIRAAAVVVAAYVGEEVL